MTRAKLSSGAVAALTSPLQTVTVEGVGTGFFAGVAEPAFVLGFGHFVGGFFSNSTSIVTESNVQAICGRQAAGGATASSNRADGRFERKVAHAEAVLGGA